MRERENFYVSTNERPESICGGRELRESASVRFSRLQKAMMGLSLVLFFIFMFDNRISSKTQLYSLLRCQCVVVEIIGVTSDYNGARGEKPQKVIDCKC